MSKTQCTEQLQLFEVGRQQVTMTIVGKDPRQEDESLASASTINRFQHAFTRREAEKPVEERDVIFEVRRAQVERINAINDFMIDLFVRTRKKQPSQLIIDLDPTADPTHGQQQRTTWID